MRPVDVWRLRFVALGVVAVLCLRNVLVSVPVRAAWSNVNHFVLHSALEPLAVGEVVVPPVQPLVGPPTLSPTTTTASPSAWPTQALPKRLPGPRAGDHPESHWNKRKRWPTPPWPEAEKPSAVECCRVFPPEIDLPESNDTAVRDLAFLKAHPQRTTYVNRATSYFTYFPGPDRSFEYFHASIKGKSLVLHQLTDAQKREVRSQCRIFKHCNEQCISWTSQDQMSIDFSDAPLDYTACRHDFVNDTVMVHSPWLTDNFFHLNNDNLLATWSYWRHFRMLRSRRVLLQFAGHPTQNREFYTNAMNVIFSHVVELRTVQESPTPFCFPRLFWQIGWKVWYPMRDGGTGLFAPEKFKGATFEYAVWLRRQLGIPVPPPIDRSRKPRHVAWINRGQDPREMHQQVLEECEYEMKRVWNKVQVEVLTSEVLRRRNNPRALLEALATVDILIGSHGAGLTNMVYMRPGGVVVEVFEDYGRDKEFYERMAFQMNHTYLWFLADDVAGMGPHDTRPFAMAEQVVGLIAERWTSVRRMPRLLRNDHVQANVSRYLHSPT